MTRRTKQLAAAAGVAVLAAVALYRPGPLGTVKHSPLFNLRDSAGNGDHDIGPDAWRGAGGLANEVPQHRLTQFKVRDRPILNGLDGGDRIWSATKHLARQLANRRSTTKHPPSSFLQRDDRRFVQHHPFALNGDECVGCSHVDG